MLRNAFSACLAIPMLVSGVWAQSTLREAAAAAGLNFGAATNSNQVTTATSAYATALKDQFNMAVCENEMKFENTEPTLGKFNYRGGDGVATFVAANKMVMRGHNFIWHSQSGSAASKNGSRQVMLDVMKKHIDSVGGHFKDQILEWDVLNEITADGAGGLRGTFWKTTIGDDYADSALAFSRRVIGDKGHLYYNDYGGDGVNAKSTSMYNLAKKWIANKVPLDGIGLQCHLNSGFKKADISANIKRFGELGLRISLTEIDIGRGTAADWTNLMEACLENFNCVSFVTWGVSDANSWNGSGCGCLLFSGTATPKTAMVQALLDAMAKADPEVAAKRKEFTMRTPGGTTGVRTRISPLSRKAPLDGALGRFGVPVFSVGSDAVVDVLGHNRLPILKRSSEGNLRLEPQ